MIKQTSLESYPILLIMLWNIEIKRFQCDETFELEDSLTDDEVLEEVYIQEVAQNVNVDNSKGSVLKVLDWYVYDIYM